MRRLGEDLQSRYFVVNRETLYQSPVALTPYLDESRIDERALGAIIDAAYAGAGLHPDNIDTGSVILTGEALRRENAQAIGELLAELGGEFVCAAAGHHMNRGRIQQTGAPREIYERPGNQFVADFIGTTNFLRGTVNGTDRAAGFYRVASEVGDLMVRAVDALESGTKVVVSVRPEDIQLSETRPQTGANLLEGTVDTKVFLGESVDFQVKVKERALLSRAHPSLGTRVGHPIYLSLDPEKCVALKDTPE